MWERYSSIEAVSLMSRSRCKKTLYSFLSSFRNLLRNIGWFNQVAILSASESVTQTSVICKEFIKTACPWWLIDSSRTLIYIALIVSKLQTCSSTPRHCYQLRDANRLDAPLELEGFELVRCEATMGSHHTDSRWYHESRECLKHYVEWVTCKREFCLSLKWQDQ